MKKILVVDDEARMMELIGLFLKPHGFAIRPAQTGEEALTLLKTEVVHLVILDIMMPGMNGWETCQEIRKFSDVPILMLTAREGKQEVVKGLQLGADDYVTKPFDENELVARVEALLRRAPEPEGGGIHVDGFTLDTEAYSLKWPGHEVSLTMKEFRIVEALMKHSKRTYEREQLLSLAWEYNTYTDPRTVDSHIRNLRDKLRKAHFPVDQYILTVWGIGYKWK